MVNGIEMPPSEIQTKHVSPVASNNFKLKDI